MYRKQQRLLRQRLESILRETYQLDVENPAIELPPDVGLGEFALPIAFDLARRLKKAPRKIAEELVQSLNQDLNRELEGFLSFEVAGAGYINGRLHRARAVQTIAAAVAARERDGEERLDAKSLDSGNFDGGSRVHALVEHTSINPNKAAHVGHLRNAILGDTFVRLLRAAGERVDVQNYIDNTGVQVADIVVGLTHLEGFDLAAVTLLLADLRSRGERIDYYCWDLYARVSQWYEADPEQKQQRREIRLQALHAIESGGNDVADIAGLVSTAVLRRHLETMLRLGIEYDFLPRESEILRLHFWDLAFAQLKLKGVLYLETQGKNKGCWVMRRGASANSGSAPGEREEGDSDSAGGFDSSGGPDEDAKVVVRSNGTVTYVGKDIAYHLWKFGLLGRDFGYAPFFDYRDSTAWISTVEGQPEHPDFGHAQAIYNVIDSRQADPQANVIEALRGLGYEQAAANYTHFSYEMVALTPRCAMELGYELSDQDRGRPYIEVSGRKGFGVKADDLIDRLVLSAKKEVDSRHPERGDEERLGIARDIAVGALRYFMLKFTRNSVIAFDFREALSFEGETGPYVQYAVVRARNIFRKGLTKPEAVLAALPAMDAGPFLDGPEGTGIWDLWVQVARLSLVVEQCIATAEPAYLAKYAFQLAQLFNNFYHRHHILTEEDPARKQFLLATAAVVEDALVRALGWLGVAAPDVM